MKTPEHSMSTISSLSVLFNKNSNPTKNEIVNSLEGQLCRCGSHSAVFDAIENMKYNKR